MAGRVCLIVLDGLGAGAADDAAEYGDAGSDTLGHLFESVPGMKIPHLLSLGIGAVLDRSVHGALAAHGKMKELSRGKDTTSGHWEIAGLVTQRPFPVFPDGFPIELMRRFESAIGRPCLGNIAASGTRIIEDLGAEHRATGYPIVYTSADSVFQIAAHEEVIPVEDLYAMCRTARGILSGDWAVARVIARPFVGSPGRYVRTDRRRDFSLPPHGRTILDNIRDARMEVAGVGKIEDIFAGRGLTRSIHTHDNRDGVRATLEELQKPFSGLIFTNLVDFDTKFGHRRDAPGFARALEEFDGALPSIMKAMSPEDTLIITADHGNDPTFRGTDHTREQVPLLASGRGICPGEDLGVRKSFCDVAETIARLLGVPGTGEGCSFAGTGS